MNREELKLAVLKRTEEVFEIARNKYGLDIEFADLHIAFPATGKSSIATAWRRRTRGVVQYGMTFKIEAIEQQPKDCMEDSIPHEIAHLVNYMCPRTGNNHDAGWKRVCIALGGSGNRTAKGIEVILTPAKFQKKYLYEASCGTEIKLSAKMHKQVEWGMVRTLRGTNGKINSAGFVRVITVTEQRDDIKRRQAELAERQGREIVDITPEPKAPKAPPVRRAARVVASGKVKKSDLAKVYLRDNYFATSSEAIQALMVELDMTKAGASTYYYKYK